MTTKEWILLLVPIFCNGIMLAIVSRFLDQRFTEANEKRQKKQQILDNYMSLLSSVKTFFFSMVLFYEKSGIYGGKSVLKKYESELQELYRYCYSNSFLLNEYLDDTAILVEGWKSVLGYSCIDDSPTYLKPYFDNYRNTFESALRRIEKRYYGK